MTGIKDYWSVDGNYHFKFRFAWQGDHVEVYCLQHPSLNGHDPSPHKTHLFDSGRLCFVDGRQPGNQQRAEQLAAQWAEYFVSYCRSGIAKH